MFRAASRASRTFPTRPFSTTPSWKSAQPPSPGSTPPRHEPESSEPAKEPLDPSSSKAEPPIDLQQVKNRLVEWSDQAAITLRTKADDFTETTKSTFSQLGAQLNKVTGYEEIEVLKRQARIKATRQARRDAKLAYDKAVAQRSNSQREVNDMLQRKHTWNDNDVLRFTAVVREDHTIEHEEARAKADVDDSEAALDREFSELMRAILGRYHEEQIWSDKIRSASTYGQLTVLGLNLLVFILAILFVEPWKRRRLAQTFEKKTEELSREAKEATEAGLAEIRKELEEQVRILTVLAENTLRLEEGREEAAKRGQHAATNDVELSPLNPSWDQAWSSGGIAVGAFAAAAISWLCFSR
ncbi:Mdm33 family-domain-containing protein [Armillaria novae-zelandiae]|uniref:Sensitive to high expression protein 9, mitochondrial n=1 Tax=Armillaria novae-zelandiae TaxID=153914 RepID=A0AA39PNU3_9AGAR|nr:Mdm33 family-domain-containing protein [Armillaria novae-zelandiae]